MLYAGIGLLRGLVDLEQALLGLRHLHTLRLFKLVEFAADLHLGRGWKSSG